MRKLLIVAYAANLALSLVSLRVCPDPVASHFGAAGYADGWMPRTTNALVMMGLDTFVCGLFLLIPVIVRKLPDGTLNVPDRDYWLRPENRERMHAIQTPQMHLFGALTLGFLFVVELLAVRANLTEPPRLAPFPFWLAFTVYMAATVAWCVRLSRRLRRPPGP